MAYDWQKVHRHQDHRPFIGAAWWAQTPTKYNKDGTVYSRPSGPPGRFYKWFVLEPTSMRFGYAMLGILGVMIATTYTYWIVIGIMNLV